MRLKGQGLESLDVWCGGKSYSSAFVTNGEHDISLDAVDKCWLVKLSTELCFDKLWHE